MKKWDQIKETTYKNLSKKRDEMRNGYGIRWWKKNAKKLGKTPYNCPIFEITYYVFIFILNFTSWTLAPLMKLQWLEGAPRCTLLGAPGVY